MRNTEAIITEMPGELGTLLHAAGYQVRVVVEREDGATLTDEDRETIADAMDAAAERDSKAERDHPLRELIFVRSMRRGDAYDREHADDAQPTRAAVGDE